MKQVLLKSLLFIFVSSLSAAPLSVPNYDPFKQTQKILHAKKGHAILNVKKKPSYTLYAIYDDSVNINKKFYKLGDKVGSCHLYKIMQDRVVLRCAHSIKTLKFTTKKTYKRVELVQ
jgi:hypothetical protein